ncbi:hypothetical protein NCS52_01203000 [Fusarium sp. LHS14.1]|nr:hypothetical protein NCS52_01203000 [Fusarium sp. LHS14.1]
MAAIITAFRQLHTARFSDGGRPAELLPDYEALLDEFLAGGFGPGLTRGREFGVGLGAVIGFMAGPCYGMNWGCASGHRDGFCAGVAHGIAQGQMQWNW